MKEKSGRGFKILFFTEFYPPEHTAAAFRAVEHVRVWQECGAQVAVFAGYPDYPIGKVFAGYVPKLLSMDQEEGVRVLRSRIVPKPNAHMWGRVVGAVSFLFFAVVNLLFNARKIGRDYHIILGTSGTVFAALAGCICARLHRLPFVLEMRDITYLQMQATGCSPNQGRVKIMRFLEHFLCNQAKRIVVVTKGFRERLIADGISKEKIFVIPNGVNMEGKLCKQVLSKGLRLSYFGTLGISQNVQDTLDYAQAIARQVPGFQYLIIGDGAQKASLERQLAHADYPFVRLQAGMALDALEPYYEKTQLCLVVLRKNEAFEQTIPSKLFQLMGRGKAVLFIGPEGEAAQIVRKSRAGLALTGTLEADLEVLKAFFKEPNWPDRLEKMGKNGQRVARTLFSRKKLATEYLHWMQEWA